MRICLASLLVVAACRKGPLPGHSVPTAPIGSLRGHAAVLLDDGRVLVAGGTVCSSTFPEPQAQRGAVYAPATNTWTTTGPLVTPRNASARKLPDGRVLLAGGTDSQHALGTTEIFDPRTLTFSPGPDLPNPREGALFTLADGTLIVAGGLNWSVGFREDLLTADILTPDAASWRTVQLTGARSSTSVVLLPDGTLLAAGGSGPRALYSDAVRVDLRTGSVRRLPDTPKPGFLGFDAVLGDGRVIFIGPQNNTFTIFDPATEKWSVGTHDLPGESPLVVLPDGSALVLGGYEVHADDGYQTPFLNRVYGFDPRSDEWSEFSPLLAQRDLPTSTLLPDGRVLVVGGLQGIGGTCDPNVGAELYSP
jgi:hypothetical protein